MDFLKDMSIFFFKAKLLEELLVALPTGMQICGNYAFFPVAKISGSIF